MTINPEFRRNIWIQFTWSKLLAAPLMTIIASYVFLLVTDRNFEKLQSIAELAGGSVIMGLWGTRRAADALAEEVGGGTWESQRMSGLGAWQMTWGKLLGGTSFVWYCAAIAMTVILWASGRSGEREVGAETLRVVFNFVVGGLMAQAAAFAIGLVLLRKAAARHRRLTITLAQSCGFMLFFFVVAGGFRRPGPPGALDAPASFFTGGTIEWYGRLQDAAGFRSASIAIACIWAVICAYRLMRTELQYRTIPWIWTVFLLFVIGWTMGLQGGPAWAFVALVLLTYIAFFADNRDPVRYRWALLALGKRDWLQVAAAIPWWLISYLIAAILVAALYPMLPERAEFPVIDGATTPAVGMLLMAFKHLRGSLILVMLFVLRDLLVLLWLSSSPWRAKADVIGIIYLALVYWPLAAVFWMTDTASLMPVVAPIATGVVAVDYVPIAIEIAFAAFLFYARWREISRLRLA